MNQETLFLICDSNQRIEKQLFSSVVSNHESRTSWFFVSLPMSGVSLPMSGVSQKRKLFDFFLPTSVSRSSAWYNVVARITRVSLTSIFRLEVWKMGKVIFNYLIFRECRLSFRLFVSSHRVSAWGKIREIESKKVDSQGK